ncbi:hypothetical protein QBC36DRAFT_123796 [Triangularia setosa]|uniref:Secreted protein n=1 Tax=Triangularia setosa TaxID=2587417 RepID=A0AAN6WA69_9PEZI|nr:hypothetical protein QBC36DRAFT_123796 [Podospora setosa]
MLCSLPQLAMIIVVAPGPCRTTDPCSKSSLCVPFPCWHFSGAWIFFLFCFLSRAYSLDKPSQTHTISHPLLEGSLSSSNYRHLLYTFLPPPPPFQ